MTTIKNQFILLACIVQGRESLNDVNLRNFDMCNRILHFLVLPLLGVVMLLLAGGCASVPITKSLELVQDTNQFDTIVLGPVEITDSMPADPASSHRRTLLTGSDYQRSLRKALLDSGLARQVSIRDSLQDSIADDGALLLRVTIDKNRSDFLGCNWIVPVGVIFFCVPTFGAGTPIMLTWPHDNYGCVSEGDLILSDMHTKKVVLRERIQTEVTSTANEYNGKKILGQMEQTLVWNFAGSCCSVLRDRLTADKTLARELMALSSQKLVATLPTVATDAASNQSSERLSSAASPGTRWAVCVGISKHAKTGQNGLVDLPYAADDANMFVDRLVKSGWSADHIKCLVNEQATEVNVRVALESWLTKAGSQDLIVFYWAGHGFPDPDDPQRVYFACYDTDLAVPATGYRMDRIRSALEERHARNVVLLADTCHAGALVTRDNERGISVLPAIHTMNKRGSVPKGWVFMVSADTDRKAVEHSSWRNGAFTHCLLEGLAGSADGFQSIGAKDGVVTLGELRAYLDAAMPEQTQKVLGVAKHPLITTSSGDPSIWNLTLQP